MSNMSVGTAYVDIEPDFTGLNQKVRAQIAPLAKDFGGKFGRAMGPVMAQQSKHLETFSRAAKIATVGAAGLAAYGFKDVVEAGAQFEKQMDTNAAISEATRRQMALLEKQAIRLGKATFFSANETAEAQAELIKGGLKVKQVLGGGLPAALSLAEAGQLELATAAETTVNAMKLFGLQGKEASSVADMLSTAANRTTADVLDFAMALKQGGSVTKLAGYDMDKTVTVLESLAEAGIKNSDAGTSMKAAVIQLLKPNKKQAELAKELNLHLTTQAGTLKSAVGLSKELRLATGDMTKAERAKTLATLAGTDGVRTLNALYMETPAHLRALEAANAKQGTAQEIASKKMDNFAGLWEQFKGSLETSEIQIYKGMAPALKDLTEEATKAANRVTAVFEDPNLSGSQKVEKAIEVLSHEVGAIWDRNDMTDHLVDLMDAAIPIVAEHAGKLGFEAAKGFGKGFLHASPLGKAVMAAWAINFIGGRAAFVGVGRYFGLSLGKEIAKTAAATAVTEIAATSAVTTAASAAAVSRWSPASPMLGSRAARQAASTATSRALLEDAFGGATIATMGGGLRKAEKSSALKGLASKLGRSSAAQFAGGFAGSVGGVLKGIRWGRIGGVGAGIALAESLIEGFEYEAAKKSPDLKESLGAIASHGSGLFGDVNRQLDKFDPFAGSAAIEQAKQLKGIYESLQKKRQEFNPVFNRDIASQAEQLDLTKAQRKEIDRMLSLMRQSAQLKVGIDLGMDPAKLRKIRQDFNYLKHGIGTNMADISRVASRAGRNIATTFGRDTAEGRRLAAQNMRATASAIKQQMERSGHETKSGMARVRELIRNANLLSPTQKQARAFGQAWADGMDHSKDVTKQGVKAMIAEANKMPGPMRQIALHTWLDQIKQAKRSGDITVDQFRSMRSRILSEFGNIQKGGSKQGKGLADGWIGNVTRLVNTTGSALETLVSNFNNAGDGFGVKAMKFVAQTVATQKRQKGGFIVPGSGDGDTFHTALPPGSFIENREAVKALPFAKGGLMPVALEPGERAYLPHEVKAIGQRTLEARNRAVPRFQKGGPLGRPVLTGPDGSLKDLGQAAIDQVYKGAKVYLDKHRLAGVGGSVKDHPELQAGISAIVATVLKRWPDLSIISTTGGGHATNSLHYGGRAADLAAGPGYMLKAAAWIRSKLGPLLTEGIHNPNLSVKYGKDVAPGFWGPAVWADHLDHIHLGKQRGGLLQALAGGGLVEAVGEILMRNNLDLVSSAGILGNAWRESRWKPSSVGTGGGGLWGFTTSPISLADLKAYAASRGTPWTSELAQTQFMLHHLPGSMRNAMNAMSGVVDTTTYFMKEWEKPGVPALGERIEGAKKALRILSGSASGGGSDIAKQVSGTYTKTKQGHTSPGGGTYAETTKGKYKVSTSKLDFGSLPSNLRACTKELRERQRELSEYRAAHRHAKDPETKRALAANIKLLEGHISALRQQRMKLMREEATKKAIKRINEAAEFAAWTKPHTGIFAKNEYAYNLAQELADQAVTLEPEEPSGAGENWIKTVLEPYVNGVESPAFAKVLGSEAEWRNSILGAEDFAGKKMVDWRKQIGEAQERISAIQALRDKDPKQYERLKDLIPGLRQRMKALRGDIVKTRGETLPEWEDVLGGVQGLGRSHEIRGSLSPDPTGEFGGNIFETQMAIRGLGLKITQAMENVSSDSSERDQMLEELLRQANQRLAVSERLSKTTEQFDAAYPPYAGKAHGGAIVPGPPTQERTLVVKGREGVFTEEQMAAMGGLVRGGDGGSYGGSPVHIEQITIHEDGRATVKFPEREVEAVVGKVLRTRTGIGRITPGGGDRRRF